MATDTKTSKQDLIPVDQDRRLQTRQSLQAILEIARGCSPTTLAEMDEADRVLAIGDALLTLRKRMQDQTVIALLRAFEGTELGFLTDRDKDKVKYPDDVLANCATSALIHGARMTGNEWNIIAGKGYLTKNYWHRMLSDHPRVSGLPYCRCRAPKIDKSEKLAEVPIALYLTIDGKQEVRKFTGEDAILVRWNEGMGYDGMRGKAEARAYRYEYERLLGISLDMDHDDPDVVEGTVERSQDQADFGAVMEEAKRHIDGADTMTEVDDLVFGYDQLLDAAHADQLAAHAKERKEQIKAGRGERSNGG